MKIPIVGDPEEDEHGKSAEELLEEVIAENFLNTGKNTSTEVHEAQTMALQSTKIGQYHNQSNRNLPMTGRERTD